MIILVNINGFSPNLVCALILWRSAFGLLMDKFCLFSPNLVCALILWRSAFGLLMDKFCLFFTELYARNTSVFYLQDNYLSKSQ